MAPYYGRNLSRQWNVIDSFNLSLGHHNLKFGVDDRHIKSPITPVAIVPLAEFLSTETVLTGTPDVSEVVGNKSATPLFNDTALFVQDEWRVHAGVTLSLGLRWDVSPPPTEEHGDNAYTLLGSIGNPASRSPAGNPTLEDRLVQSRPTAGCSVDGSRPTRT